jgi:hypothetical protein
LTITGAGARTTSVAGGPPPFEERIFENRPDLSLTITGLTITGGKATDAGGVWNRGDLTLDRVAVTGNTALAAGGGFAGGIFSQDGTLNLTDSTVSGNTATGNSATGPAGLIGGVAQLRGTANITNST